MKKNCIAMLLAGGQGSRLYALTQNVAKPSVPFGGKYIAMSAELFEDGGHAIAWAMNA